MFNTIKKKIKKCYSLNNIQSDETQINKLFIHDDSINNKIQSFKSNCLNCNKIIISNNKIINFCDLDCKSTYRIKFLIEN